MRRTVPRRLASLLGDWTPAPPDGQAWGRAPQARLYACGWRLHPVALPLVPALGFPCCPTIPSSFRLRAALVGTSCSDGCGGGREAPRRSPAPGG